LQQKHPTMRKSHEGQELVTIHENPVTRSH
jgi:hypothetical protein